MRRDARDAHRTCVAQGQSHAALAAAVDTEMRSRQRGDYSLCFLKSFSHTSQLSDLRGVTGAATGAAALVAVVEPKARTGGTNRFAALRLCASCWVGKSCDPEYGGGPGGKKPCKGMAVSRQMLPRCDWMRTLIGGRRAERLPRRRRHVRPFKARQVVFCFKCHDHLHSPSGHRS